MKMKTDRCDRWLPKVCSVAFALTLTGPAAAQALKYSPINPHFGGSPFNGAELMSSAAAQRTVKPATGTTGTAMSNFAN
ncbi:MAG: Type secretion system CsgF protein, partial [Pseudomonadota bacterium]